MRDEERVIYKEGHNVNFIEQGAWAKVNGRACRCIRTPLHQDNSRHDLAKRHSGVFSNPPEWPARSRDWHLASCSRDEFRNGIRYTNGYACTTEKQTNQHASVLYLCCDWLGRSIRVMAIYGPFFVPVIHLTQGSHGIGESITRTFCLGLILAPFPVLATSLRPIGKKCLRTGYVILDTSVQIAGRYTSFESARDELKRRKGLHKGPFAR